MNEYGSNQVSAFGKELVSGKMSKFSKFSKPNWFLKNTNKFNIFSSLCLISKLVYYRNKEKNEI